MMVVDSSGWIEFFADGPRAPTCAGHLKDLSRLATPTIVLYADSPTAKLSACTCFLLFQQCNDF
jgi:hypothetical protein